MAGFLNPSLDSKQSRLKSRAGDNASQFTTVKLSALRAGATLHNPILDEKNILLLAAGARLTPSVLQILAHRGVEFVKVHRSELHECTGGSLHTPTASYENPSTSGRGQRKPVSGSAPDEQEVRIPRPAPFRTDGFLSQIESHGEDRYDDQQSLEFLDSFEQSKSQVDSLFNNLEEISREQMDELAGVTEKSLRQMVSDMDLYLALGIATDSDLYPAQHSLQTSMLALAIGCKFGLDKRSLMELGIGCLAHDAGMLDVDQDLISSTSQLDPLRFLEITKHPTAVFDKMRSVQQIAGSSRLVAYQMHERLNGSGYPRQRSGSQIHTLSRIAAVADVFVALISPRPHRAGMVPYYAVEHLLRSTKRGEFDAQVIRSLLETISLFPIGSYIELNDGRVGRVIRTNGNAYSRPTVELWNRSCMLGDPEVVNLSQQSDLNIVRPLRALERPVSNEVRELVDAWD